MSKYLGSNECLEVFFPFTELKRRDFFILGLGLSIFSGSCSGIPPVAPIKDSGECVGGWFSLFCGVFCIKGLGLNGVGKYDILT